MALNPASVLISGANRGLGLEFVRQFLRLPKPPQHLIATCRSPGQATELQQLANENPNIHVIQFSIGDYSAHSALVQQVRTIVGDSGLSLLINNAAVCHRDSLTALSRDNMLESFDVNVVAPLILVKELLPLLETSASRHSDKGLSCSKAAIVNITSKMGSIDDNGSGGCYPYRISKTALNMATKSLAMDLAPKGILSFVVHPGWVLTEMGGPNALITTEISVQGMLKTMASTHEGGVFLNYDGKPIPW